MHFHRKKSLRCIFHAIFKAVYEIGMNKNTACSRVSLVTKYSLTWHISASTKGFWWRGVLQNQQLAFWDSLSTNTLLVQLASTFKVILKRVFDQSLHGPWQMALQKASIQRESARICAFMNSVSVYKSKPLNLNPGSKDIYDFFFLLWPKLWSCTEP